jgi:hypothetical protein
MTSFKKEKNHLLLHAKKKKLAAKKKKKKNYGILYMRFFLLRNIFYINYDDWYHKKNIKRKTLLTT